LELVASAKLLRLHMILVGFGERKKIRIYLVLGFSRWKLTFKEMCSGPNEITSC
jgi:hypothetical protein